MFFIHVSVVFLIKVRQPENKSALINNEKVTMSYCVFNPATYDEKRKLGSGGIRTHAPEETGALNQRLRPLGHATRYGNQSNSNQFPFHQKCSGRSRFTSRKSTTQDIERKTLYDQQEIKVLLFIVYKIKLKFLIILKTRVCYIRMSSLGLFFSYR